MHVEMEQQVWWVQCLMKVWVICCYNLKYKVHEYGGTCSTPEAI